MHDKDSLQKTHPHPAQTEVSELNEPPLLEVRNLSIGLLADDQQLRPVDGVSFDIRPGEILGVVGESGAGKSLVGSAIIGLLAGSLRKLEGEIYLSGQRIDTLPQEQMRKIRGARIATVFQDPFSSLNPVVPIGEQLVETIREHTPCTHAEATELAVGLLRDVGLSSPAARLPAYPHELSGGMRQRVVIALALAGRPSLIIADEPTTALDVSVQAQILRLLTDVCHKYNSAVMLVTHDMGVIAEVANRVMVMYAGRVVEIGAVDDIMTAPRHPYTQGLMASVPEIGSKLRRLPQISGSMPSVAGRPVGCAFHPRCPHQMPVCAQRPPELTGSSAWSVACWLTENRNPK